MPASTHSTQRKYPFNEVLPDQRIVEAAFLFHGNQWKMFHENAGKDADAVFLRHSPIFIDFDPFHAAARRAAFEDESTKIFLLQLRDALPRPANHALGMILTGPDGDQARRFGIAHQVHGFPGHAESAFHLRADGAVRHVFSQCVREKTVMLVTAVITDILTKQAGADTKRDFSIFFFHQMARFWSDDHRLCARMGMGCSQRF